MSASTSRQDSVGSKNTVENSTTKKYVQIVNLKLKHVLSDTQEYANILTPTTLVSLERTVPTNTNLQMKIDGVGPVYNRPSTD